MIKPEEYTCKECGKTFCDVEANPSFCPHCGAKMPEYSSEDADNGGVEIRTCNAPFPPREIEIKIRIPEDDDVIYDARTAKSLLSRIHNRVNWSKRNETQVVIANEAWLDVDGYLVVDYIEVPCSFPSPRMGTCNASCGLFKLEVNGNGGAIIRFCNGIIKATKYIDYQDERLS